MAAASRALTDGHDRSTFRDAPGVYESMHLKAIAKLTGEIEEAIEQTMQSATSTVNLVSRLASDNLDRKKADAAFARMEGPGRSSV